MIRVEEKKDKKIIILLQKEFNFNDFKNAIKRALNNDSKYYYQNRACKNYKIGDTNYALGITPIIEDKRIHNIDEVKDNSYEHVSLQISNIKDTERFYSFSNNNFNKIISALDFDVKKIFTGELISYPETWRTRNDYIIINEAFKINSKIMEEAIIQLLKNLDESRKVNYKFEAYGKKKYSIEYQRNSDLYCGICGGFNKDLIFIRREVDSVSILPRSSICFGCLPKFVHNYLDIDEKTILNYIVSKKV